MDIEAVRDLIRRALDCHGSQNPDAIWEAREAMHRRRGADCGVQCAEAFVRVEQGRNRPALPDTILTAKK